MTSTLSPIKRLDTGWYVAIGVIFTIATANVKILNVVTAGIMVVGTLYQLNGQLNDSKKG